MKSSLTLLMIALLVVNILVGCAPGPNQFKGNANEHGVLAGFWLGIWHGFIAPFVFVISLFKSNLNVYEAHNNGAWYNLGYLFGLACFFGKAATRPRAGSAPLQTPEERACRHSPAPRNVMGCIGQTSGMTSRSIRPASFQGRIFTSTQFSSTSHTRWFLF